MKQPPLTAADFPVFFRELWEGRAPFPWQREFVRRLCSGETPDYVAVPTGSGKTACIDGAVFALAVQAGLPIEERSQGRRIFFIVNRRVIVDEAYDRAGQLGKMLLSAAPESVVGRVATALRGLSGDLGSNPLVRVQLRGGIYRDRSWANSLVQPMIICSTVDQIGSRLLFRGYGVSPQARPIHAALVAQDSLLIIDEAHISRPFIQTLQWVEKYRRHQPAGAETVRLPFQLIQMTATPPADTRDDQKIVLTQEDHAHPVLSPRLSKAKAARLVLEPKAKGKVRDEQMAKRLAEEAEFILSNDPPRSIAIMVNRVATARAVAEKLEKNNKGRVSLLIGRLRPIDREAVTKRIQERLKTGSSGNSPEAEPLIVVSTQCLEVGADLDFDALVTEAASLDALRQRFGRLNRGGRDIIPRAVIVLPGDQEIPADKLDDAAPCDPIYHNAIPRTWEWLSSIVKDGVADFGINAMSTAVEALRSTGGDTALAPLLSPTADAPVMLPAYLDCWAQTNPAPAVEPDVSLFLHGPQREMADVQVCWRGDLPEAAKVDEWTEILTLCPPSSAECLPVPLHVFREWLNSRGKFDDRSSDVAQNLQLIEKKPEEFRDIDALVWRGPDDVFWANQGASIRPGDTIILRVQDGGWKSLGNIPDAPDDPMNATITSLNTDDIRRVDVAERAIASTRRLAILRIHPSIWLKQKAGTTITTLLKIAADPEKNWSAPKIKLLLNQLLEGTPTAGPFIAENRDIVKHLSAPQCRISVETYPDDRGFVIVARDPLPDSGTNETEDTDADALLEATKSQELFAHTADVLARLESTLASLPLKSWRESIVAAASIHDWGKVDPRFQALLRGTTPFAAMASTSFLAKSGSIASSAAARRFARQRACLPDGFRHEMLSVQMAETSAGTAFLPKPAILHALGLHLVATHHGYARPFAPLVNDVTPPDVGITINDASIAVATTARIENPAHALDSGMVERFWQMNRHYGWWGIALLEAVLRLADQQASANARSYSAPKVATNP